MSLRSNSATSGKKVTNLKELVISLEEQKTKRQECRNYKKGGSVTGGGGKPQNRK